MNSDPVVERFAMAEGVASGVLVVWLDEVADGSGGIVGGGAPVLEDQDALVVLVGDRREVLLVESHDQGVAVASVREDLRVRCAPLEGVADVFGGDIPFLQVGGDLRFEVLVDEEAPLTRPSVGSRRRDGVLRLPRGSLP